jgi:arylsulfatase A-like enzyme
MGKRLLITIIVLAGLKLLNAQEKANIVFILADDLGWKDVSFNGSNFYETPNIDRLASQGVFFSNAYANAPICAPSRAALLSGQYGPRTGFYTNHNSERGESSWRAVIPTTNHHQLDLDKVTIAEALKKHGYKTIHLGKWHVCDTKDHYPEYQGFDINIAGNKAGKPNTYFSPYGLPNITDGPEEEYLTDRLTEEAINFITDKREDPFFVYLSFYSPHTPLQAIDSVVWKYLPKPHDNGQFDPFYAAMIEILDYNVGRIMTHLERLNLDDNTIIVFFSDNGHSPAVAPVRPLRAYKGTLYEGGIRVPLIIKGPDVQSGIVNQTPVIGTDLYPTLLDMAGISNPRGYHLDGETLRPLLMGNGTLDRDALFWHFPAYLQGEYGMNKIWRTTPVGAVRQGDYKLLEFFEDGHLELYNLKKDPGEMYNLVKHNPEKAEVLYTLMQEWREELDVPYPLERNLDYESSSIPYNPKMDDRKGIYQPNYVKRNYY